MPNKTRKAPFLGWCLIGTCNYSPPDQNSIGCSVRCARYFSVRNSLILWLAGWGIMLSEPHLVTNLSDFLTWSSSEVHFSSKCNYQSLWYVLVDTNGRMFSNFCLGDVLCGSTQSGGALHLGILQELFGIHWWNSRAYALLLIAIFVMLPLVSLRRVGK